MGRAFLKLAANDLFRQRQDPFVVPFRVAVSLEPLPALVAFEEGVAHGYNGGVFSLTEALDHDWQRVFEQAEGTWLLPYLRRLAEGERVSEFDLVSHYIALHGSAPETFVTKG